MGRFPRCRRNAIPVQTAHVHGTRYGSYSEPSPPCFLVQCRKPFWLEVLPALEADVLPAYNEVLHFARTIVMVHELERSEFWPGSIFAAFGRPGSAQGKNSGTYPVFVFGSNDNPKPTALALGFYIWAECTFCHRVSVWTTGTLSGIGRIQSRCPVAAISSMTIRPSALSEALRGFGARWRQPTA
jgi:hypothetical protein